MLDALYRQTVQINLVDRFAQYLDRKGFDADVVTAWSAATGLLAAGCIGGLNWPLLGVLLLWGSGYLDMVDGSLARLRQSSDMGAVFDILSDRLVEAAIIISLFAVEPASRGGLSLVMMASVLLCVSSFLLVGMFSDNSSQKSFHYSPGLMERAEAFIFFSLMALFPAAFKPLAIGFIVLVLWTTLVRVYEFKSQTRRFA